MQFDEDKQDFAPTWGYKGKSNDLENAPIIEIPANAPADFDPRAKHREDKKARVEKNEKQRLANISRASAAESKKRKSSSRR
ncbi:ribosomal biogenesis regulatory protein [Cystobasidium minutum MCA 4210]|uniref:ribosomal biogenesis regulatory protein n=1 Tax=Cystobasidium minutum MCA 4210 TaxID=1397322 RepID=UPI0034CF321C|eukprot:jgi/Rhomi1/166073/fgenesh1_kg.1_\